MFIFASDRRRCSLRSQEFSSPNVRALTLVGNKVLCALACDSPLMYSTSVHLYCSCAEDRLWAVVSDSDRII